METLFQAFPLETCTRLGQKNSIPESSKKKIAFNAMHQKYDKQLAPDCLNLPSILGTKWRRSLLNANMHLLNRRNPIKLLKRKRIKRIRMNLLLKSTRPKQTSVLIAKMFFTSLVKLSSIPLTDATFSRL